MQLNKFAQSTDRSLQSLKKKAPSYNLTDVQLAKDSSITEVSKLPDQVCNGLSQCWQLRPGLNLMVHDLKFREKAVVSQRSSDSATTIGMSFCVEGEVQGRSSQAKQAIQLQSGQASLGILRSADRTIEYAAKRLLLVHLHIRPEAIGLANQEMMKQLPRALRRAITKRDSADYFQAHTMTMVMSATVQQLLNCPYSGLSQRLYLEGKAVELMSLYFDQILTSHNFPIASSDLSSGLSPDLKEDEVDRIFHARDILLRQATNPPKLVELAHQVGINDRKLKQGFRQVFGTTVFGYLHLYRMKQAHQLLLLPKATIASVSQSIGYTSPEAFSVAFRRAFGIGPKAYQMQQR